MSKKILIIGVAVLLIGGFLWWLFTASSKPLPGEKMADMGRNHVPAGTKVNYNSNPPTSGDHYADWIRAGVYPEPKDDRNLVHSLEHGYIVMSYKCSDNSAEASQSAKPDSRCEDRKNQLTKIYEKKGKRKLIVVPRSNLETNFALTAWTYLDKFDSFDANRIENFIDAYRDQGPERTVE